MPIKWSTENNMARIAIYVITDSGEFIESLKSEAFQCAFGTNKVDASQANMMGGAPVLVFDIPSTGAAKKFDMNVSKMTDLRSKLPQSGKESFSVNIFISSTAKQTESRTSTWIPSDLSDSTVKENVLKAAKRSLDIVMADETTERNEMTIVATKKGGVDDFWIPCTHALHITTGNTSEHHAEVISMVGRYIFSVFK